MTNSHTHTGYQCNTVSTNTAQSVAIPSAPHGGWSTSSEYTMVIDASRLSSLSVSDDKCGQSVTYKPSDIVEGLQELAKKETIVKPKRVIFNNPATVVIWGDDSKTVVKCAPDAVFNEYAGFCAAVAKKIFGTNNGIRRAAGLPKEKRNKVKENEN